MYYKYLPTLISIFFYAWGNNLISSKLTRVNPVTTVAAYSGVMFLASLVLLFVIMVTFKSTRYELVLPTKEEFINQMQVGFGFIVADLLLTLGYSIGVSLMFSTSCYGLIPVAALLVRFFRTGEIPNLFYLFACLTGVITLMLVAYGDKHEMLQAR